MATQTVNVTFTAAQTASPTWTTMPGNYIVVPGQPVVTDSGGPVAIDLTSVTASGATVNASAPFTGTVSLVILDA